MYRYVCVFSIFTLHCNERQLYIHVGHIILSQSTDLGTLLQSGHSWLFLINACLPGHYKLNLGAIISCRGEGIAQCVESL